ncbi:Wzz/FepE/Etk N-terminal domain-containing protein [uncultured Clostridium sp.]|uniref:YveK family protein n=1 Tax=uncultured Clostridium sp. TaxID=59620 RepID=UPI0025E22938|nr:Wzz/FepE/Etk N-terminal domain-containing protein [uncultured Clostridium sp.]
MNQENIKVQDIVDAIRNRWQLIVSITLTSVIIASFFTLFIVKPKYEASTKLFIGKESSENKDQSYSSNDVQMYQKLLKTYSDVIMTSDLVERALSSESLDVDSELVLAGLTVTPKTDTQILQIQYTNTDKNLAMEVVDAITQEFVKTSSELISNANVKIIETVKLPQSPVSPNKKLNISVAFVLGLLISTTLALVLEFMNNTFKYKEQVENILGVPVIGTIPNTDIVK